MENKDRRRMLTTDQKLNVEVITTAPVSPDGGWGWIVVIATFFLAAILDGTYATFGILFVHFQEHFGESKATTSWAGSVLGGSSYLSGVLASALATRYSFRRITIGGSLLAASSLFVSSFSPNIVTFIFFYGFMTGVGLGITFLSSMVMVGYYFKERRALATSIALCGAGTGTLVFAPFIEYLIDMYDWRGALWILAAVVSHGAVFGALLRPLEPIVGASDERALVPETSPIAGSAPGTHNHEIQKPNNNVITVDETSLANTNLLTDLKKQKLDIDLKESSARLSWDESKGASSSRNRCMTLDPSMLREPNTNIDDNLNVGSLDVTRHPYRKDIFYSGSMYLLPHYVSHSSVNKYAESVTPVADDGNTKMTRSFEWIYILKSALTDTLDLSLLTNIPFVIYTVSCFLSTMVIYVPLSFFPTMAMEIGSDSQQAAFLVSVLGITNTVSRIFVGILCDRPWVDILLVNNIGLILAGMATMAVPLYKTYGLMVTYCAFFGILEAPFFALRVVIAVELMGLDKLSSALGFITLAQGVGLILGIPMAGALSDATRSFDATFYVSGLVLILGGTMCFPLWRLKKWETARRKRQSENAKKNCETIELLKL